MNKLKLHHQVSLLLLVTILSCNNTVPNKILSYVVIKDKVNDTLSIQLSTDSIKDGKTLFGNYNTKDSASQAIKSYNDSINTIMNSNKVLNSAEPLSTLPFTMQKQPELNLCWAAVAASISKFYDSPSNIELCKIVNNVLGRKDCCSNLTICNKPNSLNTALQQNGNLKKVIQGVPSNNEIRQEVNNGYVVALRIEWLTNNQGHFIVIYGLDNNDNVYVKDPWPTSNPNPMKMANLKLFYQEVGQITHTYFTKKFIDN